MGSRDAFIALLAALFCGCFMSQELYLAPSGLFSDPHDSKAPPGALKTADNVVIRRDGVVQPRPGFAYGKTVVAIVNRAIPYDGDMVISVGGGTDQIQWYSDLSEIQDETASTITELAENFRGAQARKNLYITFSDGVQKVTAALDNETRPAGAPRGGGIFIAGGGAGTGVSDTKVVRYRYLTQREDANGVVLRGAPSDSVILTNVLGATADPVVQVVLNGSEVAGDVVELYKSVEFDAGVIPDGELRLCEQFTLTATEVGSGFYNFTQSTPESSLGATIYTAPSREGALQANFRPPLCTDMALFKGSMFFGNTETPQRKTFRYTQTTAADLVGVATGAGEREVTGDTTDESADIANISDATGFQVGQFVSGTGISANSFIITIAGTTITISNPATATNIGATLKVRDTITIGSAAANATFSVSNGTVVAISYTINISSNVYLSSNTSSVGAGIYDGSVSDLTIESIVLGSSAWYVWGTQGGSYFPALTGPTNVGGTLTFSEANGIVSSSDDRDHGVMWSKNDEPEHVPEVNFQTIGSEKHAIQRIIPTKDALFIFKKDGIYRLTGAGEASGWRIDEFDLSTFLLRPDCVAELDEAIYAWTNKGLVRVTDAGVVRLSETAVGKELRAVEHALENSVTTTWGAFVTANAKDNEIIIAVPAAVGDASPANLYIFNTKTLAWYTWARTPSHLVPNPADGKLYLFEGTDSHLERIAGAVTDVSDRNHSVTVATASTTAITINGGSGWTPAVGDMVIQSSVVYVVTAFSSATAFTVDIAGLTAAAAVAYVAFQSDIEWESKTGGNEGTKKHYQRGAFIFDDFSGIERQTYKFTSSLSTSSDSYTETFTRTTGDLVKSSRFLVPISQSRVSHLYPEIEIKQAGATWELVGLSLHFTPMAERSLRR